MTKCAACNNVILMGGVKDGDATFCNAKCHERGLWAAMIGQVTPEMAQSEAAQIHQGTCPKCSGPGPVDIHRSHFIWAAIRFSRFGHIDNLCCQACGKKIQRFALAKCFVLGWWSIRGIIMTPIKLVHNIGEMRKPPDPARPSDRLLGAARVQVAKRLAAQAKSEGKAFGQPGIAASAPAAASAIGTSSNQPFETTTGSPFSS